MKERFLEKLAYFSGLIPLGAIFGVVAFLANIEIKDLDLWLHLGMGKFITEHRFIPNTDILSCAIAGKEWINHEWLFQVLIYNIYQWGGTNALLLMQTGVVLLTLLLLLVLGYNRDNQLVVAVTLIVVSLVYVQRFTIRPDIFSLLFFSLYIFILALHIDKRWSIFALFCIQVLWSNMHGFFFFGPLFIFIGIVSEWIKRRVVLPYLWNQTGRLTDQEFKRLQLSLLVTIIACLLNPHTFKGAWYPIGVFFSISGDHKIFFEHIQELQKPILHFRDLFDFNDNPHYKLLIIISAISFIFNRQFIDISAFIFWVVFLIFSLKASRNLAFFSLAAYLVIVTNFVNISLKNIIPLRFTARKFQSITMIAVNILLLVWIFNFAQLASSRGYYDFDRMVRKSEFKDVTLKNLPYKAVNFLIENQIKGNFFNDFNSGAYLVGRTYPFIKVMIDGRTEVYGPEFFKDYRSIWVNGNVKLFDEYVEKYKLTGAFLNSSMQFIPKELVKHLYESPEWKLVYFDHDAVIFLKNIPENQVWIEKMAINLSDWKVKKMDLKKIGAIDSGPYQNYYRAYTLELLDLDEEALEEASEELKLDTRYGDVYELIGKIYTKRKDYKKAFEYFRLAAMLTPSNKERRYNLAKVYTDMGEIEYAIREYENIMKVWPNDAKAHVLVSKGYLTVYDYPRALDNARQALILDSKSTGDVIKIADQAFEQGAFNEAKEIYQLNMVGKSNVFMLHRKLAAVYKAMGQLDKVKEELNKALKENHDKPDEIEAVKKELQEMG